MSFLCHKQRNYIFYKTCKKTILLRITLCNTNWTRVQFQRKMYTRAINTIIPLNLYHITKHYKFVHFCKSQTEITFNYTLQLILLLSEVFIFNISLVDSRITKSVLIFISFCSKCLFLPKYFNASIQAMAMSCNGASIVVNAGII